MTWKIEMGFFNHRKRTKVQWKSSFWLSIPKSRVERRWRQRFFRDAECPNKSNGNKTSQWCLNTEAGCLEGLQTFRRWRCSKLSCMRPEQCDVTGDVWRIVFSWFDVVCKMVLIFKENVLGFADVSFFLNVGRDVFLNTFWSSAEQHYNC